MTPNRPQIDPKSTPKRLQVGTSFFNDLRVHFWPHFGRPFGAPWRPKSNQNASQKPIENSIGKNMIFSSVLDFIWRHISSKNQCFLPPVFCAQILHDFHENFRRFQSVASSKTTKHVFFLLFRIISNLYEKT